MPFGILDKLGGDAGDLTQAELLALVEISRAGQGQDEQDRGPGLPEAQAAIQSGGATAAQQPGFWRSRRH